MLLLGCFSSKSYICFSRDVVGAKDFAQDSAKHDIIDLKNLVFPG